MLNTAGRLGGGWDTKVSQRDLLITTLKRPVHKHSCCGWTREPTANGPLCCLQSGSHKRDVNKAWPGRRRKGLNLRYECIPLLLTCRRNGSVTSQSSHQLADAWFCWAQHTRLHPLRNQPKHTTHLAPNPPLTAAGK